MPRYTLDVKAFFTVTVAAPDEATARRMVNALDGNDANLGAWPNGDPVVVGLSFDGEHDLIETEDEEP